MKKRFLSLLLCMVLALGLLPTVVFATGSGTGKAIQLVDSGTAANIGGGQADNIYFGTYQQSSDGNDGYNTDPIKWRVLENADGQLFLLSDQNLDVFQYHTEYESVTWEKSTMRSWLNGYGASENTGGDSGTDYTSDNFISTAFSEKEQAAIADTEVVNNNNLDYNTEGGNGTTDKIFLLSIEEANNSSYFPNGNDSRISTNTAYVAGGGKIGSSGMYDVGEAGRWWLRSPGTDDSHAADVSVIGGVLRYGYNVRYAYGAVRPAFNLDLESVLFTSAAVGGKSAEGMDNGLTAIADYTGNEWKLTLLDNSSGRTSFYANAAGNATCTNTYGYSNWAVSIGYGYAITGENEYVSAMLVDSSNNILYYGRLKNAANTDDSGGNLNISIPAGLSAGTYTLKVFSEQCNGDYKTDYASAFQDVTLTVTKITPTLTLSANSGTVYSNAGTTSFTYTYDGDGAVSAVSSDAEVATVSLDTENKTVTATILKAGKATITVSAADGTNFLDVNQTYALTVNQYVAPSHDDPSYSITVNEAEHGTVTSSRRYAERGDRVTLTVEPEKGWTLETLTVTNQNGKEIDLDIVEIGEKYTFKMPSGKVTVTATFMEDNTMLNYFVDVNAQDYFYDAVLWAAENGVTYGVDDIHFAPNEPCTRAQIVSFLWRAAGSPEPKSLNSFTDVAADSYYAKAVAWAVEKGITYGTGDGKFSPNATCTRAQAVTFLYRAAGSPAVSGYAEFDDVMTDAYYARAVAWATEQGVTEGVGSHRFAPDNTCTRGQIVTFLWRSQAD